jgi:hypothetical protein
MIKAKYSLTVHIGAPERSIVPPWSLGEMKLVGEESERHANHYDQMSKRMLKEAAGKTQHKCWKLTRQMLCF